MWRRPLEWNLNGTTDPRDGSVDHLSLNSLKDRHGPIRAPKPIGAEFSTPFSPETRAPVSSFLHARGPCLDQLPQHRRPSATGMSFGSKSMGALIGRRPPAITCARRSKRQSVVTSA